MDEKISFQEHIVDLHKKLRTSIRQFHFLQNVCSIALLQTLSIALIFLITVQYNMIYYVGEGLKILNDSLHVTYSKLFSVSNEKL